MHWRIDKTITIYVDTQMLSFYHGPCPQSFTQGKKIVNLSRKNNQKQRRKPQQLLEVFRLPKKDIISSQNLTPPKNPKTPKPQFLPGQNPEMGEINFCLKMVRGLSFCPFGANFLNLTPFVIKIFFAILRGQHQSKSGGGGGGGGGGGWFWGTFGIALEM